MKIARALLLAVVVIVVLLDTSNAKKRKKPMGMLRQKETNPINFMRLAVMRVIYGVATRIGFGEQISEALNGVFVPPGVEDYDYDGGDYDY